jgi:hypothetical protein
MGIYTSMRTDLKLDPKHRDHDDVVRLFQWMISDKNNGPNLNPDFKIDTTEPMSEENRSILYLMETDFKGFFKTDRWRSVLGRASNKDEQSTITLSPEGHWHLKTKASFKNRWEVRLFHAWVLPYCLPQPDYQPIVVELCEESDYEVCYTQSGKNYAVYIKPPKDES